MNDPNEYGDQLDNAIAKWGPKFDPVWTFTQWNPPPMASGPAVFIPKNRIVAWEPEYAANRRVEVGSVIHLVGGEKIAVGQSCETILRLWENVEC